MIKQQAQIQQLSSNSTWHSHFGMLYLICIFCFSLLSFHRGLLDYTLLPRYTCASFVFLLTALFLGLKSISKNNDIRWPQIDWATGLLLGYFIWSTISILWATNFSEAVFESQKIILGFAAFYMCRWFQLNDATFVARLLKTIMVISVGALAFSSWQIFQLDNSIENAYYEVRGISGHKNLFSTTLFLIAGFLGIAYFKLENNWRKATMLLFPLTILLIIYLKTRSVYLGMAMVATIFLFNKLKQKLRPTSASLLSKVSIAVIFLGLLGFLFLWQSNQLVPLLHASKIDQLWQSDTGYERLMLWEKTACVIRESPIWGVGAGNWQIEYPNCNVHGLYAVEVDFTTFQRPHNDWLWAWAETGIIGLVCYLGFFVTIMLGSLRNLKKNPSSPNLLPELLRLSFIAGFMVIACFSFPKERIEILLLIFTLAGLLYPALPKKDIKSAHFAKLVLVIMILSTSLNLYIGSKRMTGEKYMREVLMLKRAKKWNELIRASDRAFSKWYTIDPTTIPIHWHRGTANFILGKQEAALQDFLKAERYTPFNQHIQNDLGSCYETLGQKEKARTYYEESIRISPMFEDPRINIAVSYYNDGQYQKALDWINSIRNEELKTKYQRIIINRKNSKK